MNATVPPVNAAYGTRIAGRQLSTRKFTAIDEGTDRGDTKSLIPHLHPPLTINLRLSVIAHTANLEYQVLVHRMLYLAVPPATARGLTMALALRPVHNLSFFLSVLACFRHGMPGQAPLL